MSHLIVIGVNHHRAPVALRERMNFSEADADTFLNQLAAEGLLEEGIFLSTCNRTELMAAVSDLAVIEVLQTRLRENRRIPASDLSGYWTVHQGPSAIRHMFRVTASLDAMVVGEAQILGQVKEAYHRARRLGLLQHVLHRTLQRAFSVAKQVRSQTQVAQLPVSVSAVAVELAAHIFGTLDGKQVLLLGTGEMCQLAATHLKSAGVSQLAVASRGGDHATRFAQTLGAHLYSWVELPAALQVSDIVITATESDAPIITVPLLSEAMAARHAPVFCIDIAMPRNVAPEVDQIDDVYLYNLDDLKKVVAANQDLRRAEAEKAEEWVTQAVDEFVAELKVLQVVPAIASLHRKCEDIRSAEVDKAMAKMPQASPEVRLVVDQCTQAIVAKILHQPVVNLKETHVTEAEEEARRPALDFFRRLFGLEA